MGKIRDSGTEQGTYQYLDTDCSDWDEKMYSIINEAYGRAATDNFNNFSYIVR
jgi:hypothetical protein